MSGVDMDEIYIEQWGPGYIYFRVHEEDVVGVTLTYAKALELWQKLGILLEEMS
jgi:hypothetical protein